MPEPPPELPPAPSIILCGARGIGAVHGRILAKLGAQIVGVVGATVARAQAAASALEATNGLPPIVPMDANGLKTADPASALFVCSPNATHGELIEIGHTLGMPVFCEKPLFDLNEAGDADCSVIDLAGGPGVFLNVPNRHLLKAVDWRNFAETTQFRFVFHTNGPNTELDILRDLVPHGVSLLQTLWGIAEIGAIERQVSKSAVQVAFEYGRRKVEFDFAEGAELKKRLEFGEPGAMVVRRQQGHGSTYQVSLIDEAVQREVVVTDPFETEIGGFLDWLRAGCPAPECEQATQFALANQRLSRQLCG